MTTIICAETHADFLNQAFGTNYKGYMRGRWNYDENTWVWIVRMDSKVRSGWRNRIIDQNEIWEEYVLDGDPSYSDESERMYRIAVNVVDTPIGRQYHILGKYKFDFKNSTTKKHILTKET